MKLRCTTNSIRLRLRRSEMEDLLGQKEVSDAVSFGPGQTFRFVLKLDAQREVLHAQREDFGISISLPQHLGQQWIQSDRVGLEAEQAIGAGQSLQLLIEKDFPCTTRPGEDGKDFFGELRTDRNPNC